jgi:hypothetical protein
VLRFDGFDYLINGYIRGNRVSGLNEAKLDHANTAQKERYERQQDLIHDYLS